MKLRSIEAPLWVVVPAGLLGVFTTAFWLGIAALATKQDDPLAVTAWIITIFSLVVTVILIAGIVKPDATLGGALGLAGFTTGSVFSLFGSFDDMVHGKFADSTDWQTWSWAASVLFATTTMLMMNRKRKDTEQ